MNPRRTLLLTFTLAITAAVVCLHFETVADEPPGKDSPAKEPVVKEPAAPERAANDAKETAAFMRAKLASSQKVLEGLVSKDFDLITAGAKELEQMSDAAAFQRYRDPVYRHYSREFRRQAGKLQRLGDDRNLDGASFTYMHAMTTCISCHEYVRDVIRVADADKLPPHDGKLREIGH